VNLRGFLVPAILDPKLILLLFWVTPVLILPYGQADILEDLHNIEKCLVCFN